MAVRRDKGEGACRGKADEWHFVCDEKQRPRRVTVPAYGIGRERTVKARTTTTEVSTAKWGAEQVW